MNVKVKAKVISVYDQYEYYTRYSIKYTYKVKGFKKKLNYIRIIWKKHNEDKNAYEYDRRVIKELGLLTVEEVIEQVKEDILKDLNWRITTNTNEKEKERLLKEFSRIKFNFSIKTTK